MNEKIWLVGAGYMAVEYAKVLKSLGVGFITIGRSEKNAAAFREKTECIAITGGLNDFLKSNPDIPEKVIIATGIESLAETGIQLIENGVRQILCEKPGGLNLNQIQKVSEIAELNNADVYLAYNRRFYGSVIKALEFIEQDGGVVSFNFEFTEWSHVIAPLIKAPGVKELWFLGNSTHVVDLAFYLGGRPKEICSFKEGKLSWHPSSSIFAGAGISEKGALFSYQANWEAPGRWVVEILTRRHRFYFKPMEKLQTQNIGSVQVDFVDIDDELDIKFKPGLYLQTSSFLKGEINNFITIHDQLSLLPIYNKIAGYTA